MILFHVSPRVKSLSCLELIRFRGLSKEANANAVEKFHPSPELLPGSGVKSCQGEARATPFIYGPRIWMEWGCPDHSLLLNIYHCYGAMPEHWPEARGLAMPMWGRCWRQ